MSNSNSSSDRSRRLGRVTVFLLFGLLSGVAWFAALVVVTGTVVYDLSRYGFAFSVLVALVGLFFRPWREYGLGVFIVGLLLGITCWAVLAPPSVPLGGRLMIAMILFGVPLGTTALSGAGFFLAFRRADRKTCLAGDRRGPAAAPRRFGIGTMMIVVLAISLLFSGANWLELPHILPLYAGGFLGIVGVLQMLMNRVPRAASVATGAVLLPMTLAVNWTTIGANLNPMLAPLVRNPPDLVFLVAHLAAVGAVSGYVGGALVAGLFLVIELADRQLRHSRVGKSPA